METTIKSLSAKDVRAFVQLLRLFETAFEMEAFTLPSTKHLTLLLSKPNFLAVVATVNGSVVGGLTVYFLDQYYSTQPVAYLYDLAVAPPFQRRGIGKALINALRAFCIKRDVKEIFVQADKVDAHALQFYRSTKPQSAEEGVQFTYLL